MSISSARTRRSAILTLPMSGGDNNLEILSDSIDHSQDEKIGLKDNLNDDTAWNQFCNGLMKTNVVGIVLLVSIVTLLGYYNLTDFMSYVFNTSSTTAKRGVDVQTTFLGSRTTEIIAPSLDVKPLMLNVGQGTTATHVFFHATCHLNLTSIHWHMFCYPSEVQKANNLSRSKRIAIGAHEEARNIYKTLSRDCMTTIRAGDELSEKCSIEGTVELLRRMKEAVNTVVTSGEVDVLHDSPYPMMADYIRNARINHYRKIEGNNNITTSNLSSMGFEKDPMTFYMMSERDPKDWIVSRIKHHHDQLYCRAFFNNDTAAPLWQKYDNNPFDPFDLDLCLKHTLESSPLGSESAPQYCSDVFVTHKFFKKQAKKSRSKTDDHDFQKEHDEAKFIIEQMQHIFEAGQNYYRNQTTFRINLFDLDERLDDSGLATKILDSLPDVMSGKNNSVDPTSSQRFSESTEVGLDGGFKLGRTFKMRSTYQAYYKGKQSTN